MPYDHQSGMVYQCVIFVPGNNKHRETFLQLAPGPSPLIWSPVFQGVIGIVHPFGFYETRLSAIHEVLPVWPTNITSFKLDTMGVHSGKKPHGVPDSVVDLLFWLG